MKLWKNCASRRTVKNVVVLLFLLAVFLSGAILVIVNVVQKAGSGIVYDSNNVPARRVVLLLGAGVRPDGNMSDMFVDRAQVAAELYKAGKAKKILVSGDHGRKNYDEVDAAGKYLMEHGVNGEDIFLDYAGFDTYDSVCRARDIFKVNSMIIVTQEYHLPRALYIAKGLGVDAVGAKADLHVYGGQWYRDLREKIADVKAWIDVALKSKPKFLGEPIPIFEVGLMGLRNLS